MRTDLTWLRTGLPLAVAVIGIVVALTVDTTVGLALIAAAIAIAAANFWIRLSLSSNDDRADEDRARREFERTGRWPDET